MLQLPNYQLTSRQHTKHQTENIKGHDFRFQQSFLFGGVKGGKEDVIRNGLYGLLNNSVPMSRKIRTGTPNVPRYS